MAGPRRPAPGTRGSASSRWIEPSVFDAAVEAGFDWLTVAEHHYSQAQLAPNPVVAAAAISQRYRDVKVAVLGIVLPLVNPVRAAEEIGMLDMLSGGRAIVGFFRGIPNEFLTYGTNPSDSRAMHEEVLELLLTSWSEPHAFGWEGRFYRYRTVAVWPRPVQEPHPPLLLAGTQRLLRQIRRAQARDAAFLPTRRRRPLSLPPPTGPRRPRRGGSRPRTTSSSVRALTWPRPTSSGPVGGS